MKIDYTITPSADGTYIILEIIGKVTPQIAMQWILESHEMGRELGLNHYLVDAREARNVSSAFQNYDFIYQEMKDTPEVDQEACVVLLVSPEDRSHDFIETLARNAGQDITLFRDHDEATAYLLKRIARDEGLLPGPG